jgi:hypothetical protein
MHAPLAKLPAPPQQERSRSRRERRSDTARRPVLHVVMPGLEVGRALPRPRETITAFLRRTGWAVHDKVYGWQFKKGLPTVLEVNGVSVLRKQWRSTRISANDNVQFVSHPLGGQGGSGKQVIGLVALVALAAFSGGIASAALGAVGISSTTAILGSLTAGQALAGALVFGGALLINSLTAPKAGATNSPDATTDQIYSVAAQGNIAKIGQPLPIWYGRLKDYPDFAATPWGEFVGNDQYLNILLSPTMGSMEYEQLLIGDTPFWNPTDGVLPVAASAQVAFYEPGETVTLFPVSVSQAEEVTGQQLPHGTGYSTIIQTNPTTPGDWLGGYVANPAGTLAQEIAVDYVLPAGCFFQNDKGQTIAVLIGLRAERRQVNDAGAPIGDWVELFDVQVAYAGHSPIRDSFKVAVPDGRYEVRFRRNDGVPPEDKGASDVIWAGLRSFLKGNNSFPDVSTIAIRIKASESTQGSYKFGVIGTRKLPVWDADSATFVTQATRNPAWAFLDAVSNEQYGSQLSLSKVDFNAIVAHAAGCDTRGDSFDYRFTAAISVPEAFDKILTPSRARHFWLGDTVSIVRDEWRGVPAMLLTDREIVRDSTQVTFTMLGDEDPDAVVVEYIDEETWLPAQVQYPPESVDFTSTNPETKRLDGIINRDHAYRECAFYYLQSIYRRENVSIGTEYEGRAVTFGQTLRIQSELPQSYGYGGAVVSEASGTLTLDPPPSWADAGGHFLRLRKANGVWFGPVSVTKGANDNLAILGDDLATVESQQGATLEQVLAREDGAEYPSFEIGTADNQSRVVKVLSGQPNGNLCTLNLVVDDERVHATDLGNPPVLPSAQFPSNAGVPLIVGLNASFGQGIAEPKLSASWFPAAGALYYIADVSYDEGGSWQQVYEGVDNQFTAVVTLAALRLRVQAVGAVRGPYSTVDLDAPTIVIADNTVALESMIEAIRYQVTTAEDTLAAAIEEMRLNYANATRPDIARNWIDKVIQRREVSSMVGKASARIEEVWTVATSEIAALAQTQVTIEADLDQATASIVATNTALSDLDQAFTDQTTSFNSRFGSITSSLTTEIQTRTTQNTAFSASLSSLSTTVGQHTASLNFLQSSIDGQSVQAGFIGNIDGATGSLIFSGFVVNGTARFGVTIDGDLWVLKNINGTAIKAGTLDAISIKTNSITTDLLRFNSVTNLVTDAYPAVTTIRAGAVTLYSQVRTIESGTATVTWSGGFDVFTTAPSPTGPVIVFSLRVDGNVVKQWKWRMLGSSGAWFFQTSMSQPWVVTGLAVGSHTFTITADDTLAAQAPSTYDAGQVSILDLKR